MNIHIYICQYKDSYTQLHTEKPCYVYVLNVHGGFFFFHTAQMS